jgi:hypothetical protein
MALNLTPYQWNWSPITAGDTYPAARWVESDSDNTSTLARVRCTIKDVDGNTFAALDSNTSGITINTATAGAWDFTIEALSAPNVAGVYNLDVEWIDSDGVKFTEAKGEWVIGAQVTTN